MKFTTKRKMANAEARAKVEVICGRLKPYEMVHHIDCNPFNNEIDNLAIIDPKDHNYVHAQLKKRYGNKKIYYPEEMRKTFKRQNDEKRQNVPQIASEHTQNCQ